jgi:hypothetical protein
MQGYIRRNACNTCRAKDYFRVFYFVNTMFVNKPAQFFAFISLYPDLNGFEGWMDKKS